jgi:L-ascorbate metabolism protein UlaG (beta-lactamase superfamily)
MDASLTFVGTATTVLRIGAFTLLTDPNFLHRGERAYLGYGLSSKRLTEPALQPEDLPRLDAVLLSHLHGDHFDRVAKEKLPKHLPILTNRHGAAKLKVWGFTETQPLKPWESHTETRGDEVLKVTSVPGTHAPGPLAALLPPVMGSVLEWSVCGEQRLRLYITGDTLYKPSLREVVERHGPLDGMVTHLGGTRVLGVLVTMDAEQGADLVELLKPPVTIPIHNDDYTVFKSPLKRFLDVAARRGLTTEIRTVERGGTIALPARAAAPGAAGLPADQPTRT